MCLPRAGRVCRPKFLCRSSSPQWVVHRIHFSIPLKRWLEESYLFLPRPLCTNAAGSAHRDGGLLKGRVMEAWGDVLVALQGHRSLTLKTVFVVIAMLKKTKIWGPGPPSAQVLQQTQDRLSSSKDGPGSDHRCWVALPHRRVSVRLLTATREGLPNHPSAHSSGHHKSYPLHSHCVQPKPCAGTFTSKAWPSAIASMKHGVKYPTLKPCAKSGQNLSSH